MRSVSKQRQIECNKIRSRVIDIIHNAGSGHSGGSLSAVEIVWTLYEDILRIDPQNPDWEDRDRFVLSKGHAAPLLYTVLARKGFFDPEILDTLRTTGSILQGHPDMNKVPGVEMSAGSLGMGISAGIGMALASRLSNRDYRVYVLVGDGEMQEGQNYEAMMAASKYKLDNLTVILDKNGVQLDGPTEQVMPMGDMVARFEAFGFETQSCNGHSCDEMFDAYKDLENANGRPKAIGANTVKGKGVSFMEGQSAWHGAPITDELYRTAKSELAPA